MGFGSVEIYQVGHQTNQNKMIRYLSKKTTTMSTTLRSIFYIHKHLVWIFFRISGIYRIIIKFLWVKFIPSVIFQIIFLHKIFKTKFCHFNNITFSNLFPSDIISISRCLINLITHLALLMGPLCSSSSWILLGLVRSTWNLRSITWIKLCFSYEYNL